MASRQNQLHSYQFTVQRAVSALVTRDPDPAQSPFRRVVGAVFASAMIAVLALAGVGIYGLIVSGGNTTWKKQGAVIVERESGAKFVYLDGKLHPVLNLTSALLIARSSDGKAMSVSAKSLTGAARGTPLGIQGAPDSLADRDRLLGEPWTVCSTLVRQASGQIRPLSSLLVGVRPAGGRQLAREAVFVRGADAEYLVWNGHKHRVVAEDQKIVHDALVVRAEQIVPAATAWLNSVPAGADLGRVKVPGKGSSKVSGLSVGTVVRVDTPGVGVQNYAVLADGLTAITQLQANLLASDAAPTREQTPTWFAAQPRSKVTLAPGDGRAALPDGPPTLVAPASDNGAVCGVFGNASGVPGVVVDATVANADAASVTGSQSATGTVLADRVSVAPGRGALVSAVASADASSGTLCLVTDLGTAYPIAGPEVLPMLGYDGVTPLRVPAALVDLLPQGRALDPDAARAPAVGG
jgi:type VII secretion protein EccB